MEPAPTVLVVEDDPGTRSVIEALLGRRGYTVVATADGLRALPLAREVRPVAALVNLFVHGQSGCRTIEDLRAAFGDALDITAVTASDSPALAAYAHAVGANRVLRKPFSATKLLEALAAVPLPLEPVPAPARRGA